MVLCMLGVGAGAQVSTYSVSLVNTGGNPGGLNTEGDAATAGWTTFTAGGNATNSWTTAQAIGFPFEFFGQPVTQFQVSLNGLITFSTVTGTPPDDNTNLVNGQLPNNTICTFWDGFTQTPPIGSNDVVQRKVFGTAPNRQLWIRWFSFEHGIPGASFAYFACVLEETTNKIYIVDPKFFSGSITGTVGVQFNNTRAVQFGDSTINFVSGGTSATDNMYYEFTPFPILPINLSARAITGPTSDCGTGPGSQITAQVENVGSSNVASFTAFYRLNNGTPVSQVFNLPVAVGQVRSFTFSPTAFNAPTSYTVDVWVKATGDGFAANDTVKGFVVQPKHKAQAPKPITFESFATNTTVRDTFYQRNAQFSLSEVASYAANGPGFGLSMTGTTTTTGWVNPNAGSEWTNNADFSSRTEICFDATGLTNLRMFYDLKQTFISQPNHSNFRVLVNGQQVTPTLQPTTASSDPFVRRFIDLAPFVGGVITVTFETRNRRASGTSRDAAFIDNIQFIVPPARDFVVNATLSPVSGECGDSLMFTEVVIQNFGTATQSNIPVRVVVSGGATATLNATAPGPLAAGERDTLLLGPFNTSAVNDTVRFTAFTLLANDANRSNDTLRYKAYLKPRISGGYAAQTTQICGPDSVRLFRPNNGLVHEWYTDAALTNLVARGNSFMTPLLSANTTYYNVSRNVETFKVGPPNNLIGSGSVNTFYTTQDLRFNVSDYVRLDSVRVYPSGTGVVRINLTNSLGTVLQTKDFTIASPILDTVLFLGFDLEPGNGYRLNPAGSSVNGFYRNSAGVQYPYTQAGIVSIVSSTGSTFQYNFFYDWTVRRISCPSYPVTYTVQVPLTPTVNLGNDTLACDPFFLSAGNFGSTYQWSTGATTQQIFVSQTGTYKVRVTTPAGCFNDDSIFVELPPSPFVDFGPDRTVCGSLRLDATNELSSYLWSTGATTPAILPTTSGTYWVRVTNVCNVVATDTIQLNVQPGAIYNLGNDTTLCVGEPLILDVSQPASAGSFFYNWSTGSTTPTIVVTTPGTYTVAVTLAGGCTVRDTLVVAYTNYPNASLGADTTICKPFTLSAPINIGATYRWNTGATTRSILVSQAGTYTVTVTNAAGCVSTDQKVVTYQAPFAVNLGADRVVCAANTLLDPQVSNQLYLWSTGDTTKTYRVRTSGTYWVRVTDRITGCEVTDTVTILLNPTPTINLGPDQTVCGSTVLDAGYPVGPYLWSTGDTTKTLRVTNSGSYSVAITAPCGQTARDTIQVTVAAVPTQPLPNTVTGCDAVTLDAANAGSTYRWSTGETSRTISATEADFYWVEITTAQGCTVRDTVYANVQNTPQATIALPDTFFVNQSILARSTVTPFAQSYSWNFGPDAQPNTANGANPVTQYTTVGSKTMILIVSNGQCTTTVTKDIVIVEAPVTGVNDLSSGLQLTISPNPTDGLLQYSLPLGTVSVATVTVRDISGRSVYQGAAQPAAVISGVIDLGDFDAGVYSLEVDTPQGKAVAKVLLF